MELCARPAGIGKGEVFVGGQESRVGIGRGGAIGHQIPAIAAVIGEGAIENLDHVAVGQLGDVFEILAGAGAEQETAAVIGGDPAIAAGRECGRIEAQIAAHASGLGYGERRCECEYD